MSAAGHGSSWLHPHTLFDLILGTNPAPVEAGGSGTGPSILATSIAVVAALVILGFVAGRKPKMVPTGLQGFFEFLLSFWWKIGESMMGPKVKQYMHLFIFLFLYILFGNLVGLVPGMISPTSSLNTTVALALIVFCYIHIAGISTKGLIGYLRHFWSGVPWWLMAPMFCIHVIGELVRPVSLAARLFGNILAKEIVLAVLVGLLLIFIPSPSVIAKSLAIFPLLLRPCIIVLGTLVSIVQASVFTMLAMIYIAGAVSDEHGH